MTLVICHCSIGCNAHLWVTDIAAIELGQDGGR